MKPGDRIVWDGSTYSRREFGTYLKSDISPTGVIRYWMFLPSRGTSECYTDRPGQIQLESEYLEQFDLGDIP